MDSLRGTREAPGRQERTIRTAWEAPGRHQGLLKAILLEDPWSWMQRWGLGLYNIYCDYSWFGSACSGGSSLGLGRHASQPSFARRPPRCRSGTPAT